MVVPGIFCIFWTFLSDPGIPRLAYARHIDTKQLVRDEFGNISGTVPCDLSGTNSDNFCMDCLVPRKPGQVHCHACRVCIEDMDHHCFFYAKCIGGKTLWTFYGSIGLFIVNAIYVFAMTGIVVFVNLIDKMEKESATSFTPQTP